MPEEKYFQHYPSDGNWFVRIGLEQRRKMFRTFLRQVEPKAGETILDVGATGNQQYAAQNYLEKWYPHKSAITAAGLEDGAFLEEQFPGLRYVKIKTGRLPFQNREFDHVHVSAVLEHVGGRGQQQEFLRELWRVAKQTVFITTPNRWFPVELHTMLPLVHWLPPAWFRQGLQWLGMNFFASEEHLNLVTRQQLKALCQAAGWQDKRIYPVRLWGWTSNWIAMGVHAQGEGYAVPDNSGVAETMP